MIRAPRFEHLSRGIGPYFGRWRDRYDSPSLRRISASKWGAMKNPTRLRMASISALIDGILSIAFARSLVTPRRPLRDRGRVKVQFWYCERLGKSTNPAQISAIAPSWRFRRWYSSARNSGALESVFFGKAFRPPSANYGARPCLRAFLYVSISAGMHKGRKRSRFLTATSASAFSVCHRGSP